MILSENRFPLFRIMLQHLIAAPIAAKVGSVRPRPAISGGFSRVRGPALGAAVGLRLAALQVFPQRRGKSRAARRLLLGLAAGDHRRSYGSGKMCGANSPSARTASPATPSRPPNQASAIISVITAAEA